jgi:hypothetical protein
MARWLSGPVEEKYQTPASATKQQNHKDAILLY